MDKKTIKTTKDESDSLPTAPSALEKVPFWLLSALLVLIPIFVIPSPLVDLLFAKTFLLATTVLVSLALVLFISIKSGKILLPGWKTLIVIGIVPLVTIISSFLSINRAGSFIGSGSEFGTLNFIGLGFILIALVAAFFQSKQRIFWSYLGLLTIFSLVSIFHIVRFILGASALNLGGAFTTVVANTLGTWNDLGTYAGLAIILAFITIELIELGSKMKAALYVVLALGLALLGVTNFYVASGILGLAIPLTLIVGLISLFVFVYIISLNYRSTKKMPVASLIVLVFCIVMTVAASPIATALYQKIGITQNDVVDVRPTIGGTYSVAESTLTKNGLVRTLFGVGPNKFFAAWGLFKPVEVNQTVFWNSDFNYGAGYILSSIVTMGVLGFLAWIIFLLGTLFAGIKAAFVGTRDRFSVYIIVSSLLATMYLWLIAVFSVPSTTILTLAFFFTGLLGASLIRERFITVKEYSWATSQKKGFVAVLLLILVLIGIVAWAFTWVQHFVASTEIQKAGAVLKSAENLPESEALIASAIQRAPSHDPYLRSYAQAKLIELQVVLEKSGKSELADDSKQILGQAIAGAEGAVQINPTDYHNLIFLGQVYQTAGLLGVEGAGDAALNAYKQAYMYIPSSPLPAYLAGYLYALAKDNTSAEVVLKQALQIKPDFKEANALYSQIQDANPGAQSTVSDDVQTSASPAKTTLEQKTTATSTATTTRSN